GRGTKRWRAIHGTRHPQRATRLLGFLLLSALIPAQAATFPLKVSANNRYLVDQQNQPFLVVGDTPRSLIVQPTEEDIEHYLDDRQHRGLNSIIVNLIEHKFCTKPPKTRLGLEPFNPPGDFSSPNTSYFDFAHNVIRKANDR